MAAVRFPGLSTFSQTTWSCFACHLQQEWKGASSCAVRMTHRTQHCLKHRQVFGSIFHNFTGHEESSEHVHNVSQRLFATSVRKAKDSGECAGGFRCRRTGFGARWQASRLEASDSDSCSDQRPSGLFRLARRRSHGRRPLAITGQTAGAGDAAAPSPVDEFLPWPNGGGLVASSADVDATVIVEPGAAIHPGARVAAMARIGSNSVVGPGVAVGTGTVIWYNVSLTNCTVGDRCILHNGVSVGQDGFGFVVNDKGEMVKKPQTLGVVIGNDVEIGANSCVDRGSWRNTEIGDHVKIDNLVQIGHNVVIGRCCILCGQVGIGGSATLGEYVVLAGQVGVADHANIVSKVRVGAKGGVPSSISEPGDYAGFPVMRAQEWRKSVVSQRRAVRSAGESSASPVTDEPRS